MGFAKLFFTTTISLPFSLLLLYSNQFYIFNTYFLLESNSLPAIIWYSGTILALLSVWALSQRTTLSKIQYVVYLMFLPLVGLFVFTKNLLIFFMCYELFLLPSFIIVFFGSPNRRGVLASIYFLMWTQVGSFLVFLSILVNFTFTSSFLFESLGVSSWIVPILAFSGFGIKVPVWPAHYWLTKTHVEAPTYFSVYLSGFLVKTALYGIWVFTATQSTLPYTGIILVGVVGVIDSSLKMWAQVDLKKLVAYGTIQEMNLILVGISLGTSLIVKATSLFILAHTILSTIFFLFADSLYKRFSSRSTTSVRGLLQTTPNLGYTLFVCCLFFAGLPFTLKFVVEVFIFVQLQQLDAGLLLISLFICNWFGIISFMKNWFTTLFGSATAVTVSDISIFEGLNYIILCSLLFILSWVSYILL